MKTSNVIFALDATPIRYSLKTLLTSALSLPLDPTCTNVHDKIIPPLSILLRIHHNLAFDVVFVPLFVVFAIPVCTVALGTLPSRVSVWFCFDSTVLSNCRLRPSPDRSICISTPSDTPNPSLISLWPLEIDSAHIRKVSNYWGT